MRVLLVNPPADHEMKGPHPLKADDMGVFPHLGLMYIASTLMEDGEFEVRLLDMALEKTSLDELGRVVCEYGPSAVGITSYTDCLYDLKLVVEKTRKEAPEAVICVGGPHVEIYPAETLEAFPVDCVIRGDGEYSFRELCRRARDGRPWRDVGGVGYIDESGVRLNAPWQVEPLDELVFPARELSSMNRVKSAVARGEAITSICSSRGCPLPCTFCNSPYKKYRLRSARNVIEEIRSVREKHGVTEFFFFDDLFNISKKRVLEICDGIAGLPYEILWSFRGRINNLDEETLRRCKEAGCNRVHFGVEAGTERILKLYKKGLKLEKVRRVFRICEEIGLETVANFMIGAPGETRGEIESTIRFANEISPTFVEYHVLIPYPYTAIYKEMLATGQIERDVWGEYVKDPRPGFVPPLSNNLIPASELYEMLNEAYRSFYFRPSYVWSQLRRIEGLSDLSKKIWGAIRLMAVTGGRQR